MTQTQIRHAPSTRSTNPETPLTTGLNSLTTTSTAQSTAVGNHGSTELDLVADLELVLGSFTPTVLSIEAYMERAIDNSNFEDSPGIFLGAFILKSGASAKRASLPDIPVPPWDFKITLKNVTGVTLASSGNTLSVKFHSLGSGG